MKKIIIFLSILFNISSVSNLHSIELGKKLLNPNLIISLADPIIRFILTNYCIRDASQYPDASQEDIAAAKKILANYGYADLDINFKYTEDEGHIADVSGNYIVFNKLDSKRLRKNKNPLCIIVQLLHSIKHVLSDGYKSLIPASIFSVISYFVFKKFESLLKNKSMKNFALLYCAKIFTHLIYFYLYKTFEEVRAENFATDRITGTNEQLTALIKDIDYQKISYISFIYDIICKTYLKRKIEAKLAEQTGG